ncbi:hypothetical protein GQ600_18188 [Phytophthora cactorum]|nr:hypothetical protein GQ600_18188 [Phytophthora cactorum]
METCADFCCCYKVLWLLDIRWAAPGANHRDAVLRVASGMRSNWLRRCVQWRRGCLCVSHRESVHVMYADLVQPLCIQEF